MICRARGPDMSNNIYSVTEALYFFPGRGGEKKDITLSVRLSSGRAQI
jgi:hypothetical protein